MLQNSIYSVISLRVVLQFYGDDNKSELAADSLCITAEQLKDKNIIDNIILEPLGGAHRDHQATIKM